MPCNTWIPPPCAAVVSHGQSAQPGPLVAADGASGGHSHIRVQDPHGHPLWTLRWTENPARPRAEKPRGSGRSYLQARPGARWSGP